MHKFQTKMMFKKLMAVFAAVLVMFIFSFSSSYAADIISFDVTSYDAKIKVSNDNTFNYKETLVIDASSLEQTQEGFHFERTISNEYIGRVSGVDVKGYDYTFDEATNVIDIEVSDIGSNTTLAFEISYTLTGVDYMGEKEDILSLPVIPDSHSAAIGHVNIVIQYPENFKIKDIHYLVGSDTTVVNEYGKWSRDKDKFQISYKGDGIPPNAGISMSATLPKAYWANATSIGITKNISLAVLAAGLLILIILKIIFGREPEMKVSEEKYPPEELSPAHVGYLIDRVVDNQDITSMFFYMAERGFLKLEEVERKSFKVTFIKAPKGESKSIKVLFDALFDKCNPGDSVMISDRAGAISKVIRKIKRTVPTDVFGGYKYFSATSHLANSLLWLTYAFVCAALPFLNMMFIRQSGGQAAKGIMLSILVAAGMCIVMENLNVSYYRMRRRLVKDGKQLLAFAVIAYIAAVIAFIYFFRFSYNGRYGDSSVMMFECVFFLIAPLMVIGMKSRSRKNVYFLGKITGLRDFMNDASKDQISDICNEDENYYFKLMPYSMAFNIARHFAGKFEYVRCKGPKWYKPYGLNDDYDFDIVIMNSMIVNLHSELNELVYGPLNLTDISIRR